MIAVLELAATEKAAIGRPGPLHQMTRATGGILLLGVAVCALEAEVVASDLGKFSDVSRWFTTFAQQKHAAACARQGDVKQASFFRMPEGFGSRFGECGM
ncbi:hypothetical protein [Martelella mediterranea]|uniref:hypothetical protein n=1 Tax=Martelella mediterranea TaxID=293089 RepID=UPI001FE081CE|nr:hypothetical protein [Martelella mediterranea]